MTALCVVILVGIPLLGVSTGPQGSLLWDLSMVLVPLGILVGSAFFTIRGFVLTRDRLLIWRLVWNTHLDLTGLISAEVDPEAMSRSLRTFGIGGLFCFAGAFRNRKLGSYRAFATDKARCVVLRFADRTVVVTPDPPDAFVTEITQLRGLKEQ